MTVAFPSEVAAARRAVVFSPFRHPERSRAEKHGPSLTPPRGAVEGSTLIPQKGEDGVIRSGTVEKNLPLTVPAKHLPCSGGLRPSHSSFSRAQTPFGHVVLFPREIPFRAD